MVAGGQKPARDAPFWCQASCHDPHELVLTGLRITMRPASTATLLFVITFVAVRGLTYSIHAGIGPFHDVSAGGTHIHHMVWGILLLLGAGYIRVVLDGSRAGRASRWASRLIAAAYGAGAALTLDEFALWLNMRDVYWHVEGWESVIAVLIFIGFLLSAISVPRLLRARGGSHHSAIGSEA